MCYAMLAAVTDYDAWHAEHGPVDARTVFQVLTRNVAVSRAIVLELLAHLPASRDCACGTSLDDALVTPPAAIDAEARARLGPILARRLGRTAP
jgi:5'-methylthioadenosine phosphorylase